MVSLCRYPNVRRPFREDDIYPKSPDRTPPRTLFTEVPLGQKLDWHEIQGATVNGVSVMFALFKRPKARRGSEDMTGDRDTPPLYPPGNYSDSNVLAVFSNEAGIFELSRHTSPDVLREVLNIPTTADGMSAKRVEVPEDKVGWDVDWPEYDPIDYTSPYTIFRSAGSPGEQVPWQSLEKPSGPPPQHPLGRTGMKGRGCLPRWGPNQTTQWVISRWKMDEAGMNMKREGTGMLEILLIKTDNDLWGLPRAFDGEVNPTLRVAFGVVDDIAEKQFANTVDSRVGGRNPQMFDTAVRTDSAEPPATGRGGTLHVDRKPKRKSKVKVERRKETSTNIQAVENFLLDDTVEDIHTAVLGDRLDTDEAWVSTTVRHLHDEGRVLNRCRMTARGAWFSVNEHIGSWLEDSTNDEMIIHAVQLSMGAYWH